MRYEFDNLQLRKRQFDVFQLIGSFTSDIDDQNLFAYQLDQNPKLVISYLQNWKQDNPYKLQQIINLFKRDHNFFSIVGTVGSGKTALAYFFLKEVSQQLDKKIYWVGSMSAAKVPCFAEHIYIDFRVLKELEKQGKSLFDLVESGSILYVDEIAHLFPKGSISKESLDQLTIYRHKSLCILGSTQNSGIISIDLVRFFTGMFILQTTLFHSENERENALINSLMLFKPTSYGRCLFYSAILQNEFMLDFQYPLLKEYDDVAGKGYGGVS